MKHLFFTFALIISLSAASSASARVVYCTNCSNNWTQSMDRVTNLDQLQNQIKTYKEAIEQTKQQIELVQNNIKQYENMLQNTLNLPQDLLGEMKGKLSALGKLTNQLNLQKGDYMAMGQTFDDIYPGVDIIKGMAGGDSEMTPGEIWKKWSEEVDRAAQATFQVTGSQLKDLAENSDMMDQHISKLLSTPEGQMQAMQSGNSLAAIQINELRELRMLMATSIQATTQMAMKEEKRGQLSKEQIDHLMDTSKVKSQYQGYYNMGK